MKNGIFICYRRNDTDDLAEQLATQLRGRFRSSDVFIDVVSANQQFNWRREIGTAMSQSSVFVALIGPLWLHSETGNSRPRLFEPDDVVRHEIDHALQAELGVLPVLVDGGLMPVAGDLPPSLSRITDFQVELLRRGLDFDNDTARIERAIARILASCSPQVSMNLRYLAAPSTTQNVLPAAALHLADNEFAAVLDRQPIPDQFLRRDPHADLTDYSGEIAIEPYLPYVEMTNWCREFASGQKPKININIDANPFVLERWADEAGNIVREAAFEARLAKKPKSFNGPAVRVNSCRADGGVFSISVQVARYFDQWRSNLALDFVAQGPHGPMPTLREMLRSDFRNRLPPLSDKRLANTLGVAALIVALHDDDFMPYLTSRSDEVALMNAGGEWHCTASGVAELREDLPVSHNIRFFRDTMLKELDEEVGLLEHELEVLEPVAFCRELMRCGKPQMFFLGTTRLSENELMEKLRKVRKKSKREGVVVENTAMTSLTGRARTYSGAERILFSQNMFTIEAAACLHYLSKCNKLVVDN